MENELIELIENRAVSKTLADGSPYRSLSLDHTKQLSARYGFDTCTVDITALEHDVIPERYARNIKTLAAGDQIRLLKSSVSIVGLGGLGGTVAEILARIGVGTLTLIDGDRFEESNLNRQLMSSENRLDTPKAEAARERIRRVNSTVTVRDHTTFLGKENAVRLVEGSDAAVDCLDNVTTRFMLEDATRETGIPLVSAAVAGVFGQITTVFPGDPGLKLIYGDREKAANKGAETSLGNLPYIVFAMASLECAEVIKVLLNQQGILRNRMLIVDLAENRFEVMQLL